MQLERYFEVSQAADLATFERHLVGFAHEMGFAFISGALVIDQPRTHAPAQFLPFGNTPDAFIDISRDYADSVRSPVNKLLKKLSVPIFYDQALYASAGAGDIWERHAPFGYKTGIAVALHLPDDKHFLIGVDRPDPLPKDQRQLTRMMADLQLLAVHAQSASVALLGVDQSSLSGVSLTPRELEILRWTRDGKSAWVVGEILRVSENTVNFHLRNIFKKFKVASKHHAVLVAMSLKLL
jgi:DNA-binding CsgD family transcriptional regulator